MLVVVIVCAVAVGLLVFGLLGVIRIAVGQATHERRFFFFFCGLFFLLISDREMPRKHAGASSCDNFNSKAHE